MKTLLKLVLAVLILFAVWLLVKQFTTPMNFVTERNAREAVIIEQLKDIRTAQHAYRQSHQRYTSSMDTLIAFVLNDSMTYERAIGSEDDSVAVARGMVRREKFRMAVKDTIYSGKGYSDQYIRNMKIVPFSDGQQVIMDAGSLTTESKVVVMVFEAKVPYKMFLSDMNEQQLINLIDERKNFEKYPGLKVGSMTEATNDAGNWE
ncbi:MAG: hypothetical protein LBU80_03415 [Rikenellaceae bacterium]|jgi:hypothetical protein|nr:hypothetical protein [Rikenellaceae bacterium]